MTSGLLPNSGLLLATGIERTDPNFEIAIVECLF